MSTHITTQNEVRTWAGQRLDSDHSLGLASLPSLIHKDPVEMASREPELVRNRRSNTCCNYDPIVLQWLYAVLPSYSSVVVQLRGR